MPHQCVRCSKLHDDGAKEILQGCSCGARLFFYVRKEQLEKAKEIAENLTKVEKKQIEKDVLDIVGVEEEKPVILDLESIKILKPGKFEIDLVQLFNRQNPLIYKLEEGKYVIDIAETFRRRDDLKQKKPKKSKKKK
jgi:predicted  nucleic acid-binding Zn-ribbon protein